MIKKLIQKGKEILINGMTFSGLGFIIMFLGTYAGSEGTSKTWRRLGIPLAFFIVSFFTCPLSWWLLTILFQNLVLRMGHGIPSK